MTKRSEKIRFKDGGENTDWQLKTSSISEYSSLVQIWKAEWVPTEYRGKNVKNNKTDFSQKYNLKKEIKKKKRFKIEDLK